LLASRRCPFYIAVKALSGCGSGSKEFVEAMEKHKAAWTRNAGFGVHQSDAGLEQTKADGYERVQLRILSTCDYSPDAVGFILV